MKKKLSQNSTYANKGFPWFLFTVYLDVQWKQDLRCESIAGLFRPILSHAGIRTHSTDFYSSTVYKKQYENHLNPHYEVSILPLAASTFHRLL